MRLLKFKNRRSFFFQKIEISGYFVGVFNKTIIIPRAFVAGMIGL